MKKLFKTGSLAFLGAIPFFVFGCVSPGQINLMDSKTDSLRFAVDTLQRKVAVMEAAYKSQLEENQKLGAQLKSSMRDLGQKMDAVSGQVQDVGGRFDYLFRNWEEFKARLQNLRPPPDSLIRQNNSPPLSNVGVDPKQLYDNAFLDFRRAKYDLAIAGFEEFLATFPSSELAPNCHFWIGESFSNKGLPDSAISRYQYVAENFPRSEKAPTSLFKAAQEFEKRGEENAAEKNYNAILERYSGSAEARRARDRLAALKKR
jgi:tol-pal system protein YbgF